ncbi:hypothetical protein FB561_2258 [Kribbella amoyensis]|uniref:Uncharacterized protein n=1 Tax=Kribbella amoyensis TaxID=996641 RepID=A0A561BQM1_9ACTN|nr:DUF4190 domain-containing protein [Kribbella amoyensis]TWD81154.1 hypothetical protein FB561_2258 [Kribbella amoyensis]
MTHPPTPVQPVRTLPSAESWLSGVPSPARRRLDGYALAAFAFSLPGLAPIAAVLAAIALPRIHKAGTRGRGLAHAALAISACWVIALGVAAVLGVYGDKQAGIGRTVAVTELEVHQCFTANLEVDTLRMVRIADCKAAHSGEAYARVPATLAGLGAEQREAVATRQCATAFEAFVGKPFEQSSLDMYYVVLEDRDVADGNVLCLVGRPERELTGTMRDSQR